MLTKCLSQKSRTIMVIFQYMKPFLPHNQIHYQQRQIVYAFRNGELQGKIKNLFVIQQYQHSKKDLEGFSRAIGEVKISAEQESMRLRKVPGCRHQFLVERGRGEGCYLYSLSYWYAPVGQQKAQEIPLTNQSIISVDIRKEAIYALISHSKHTKNKTILACEKNVSLPQPSIIQKQKHYSMTLKQLASFERQLNLHCLIVCNNSQIALLHGIGFQGCCASQYLIKTKSLGNKQIKKQQAGVQCVSSSQFGTVVSFFMKKNNYVYSLNLLQYRQNPQSYCYVQSTLDLHKFSQGWRGQRTIDHISFTHHGQLLLRPNFDMRIDGDLNISGVEIVVESGGKKYLVGVLAPKQGRVDMRREENGIVGNNTQIEMLGRVVKIQDAYVDYGYFE